MKVLICSVGGSPKPILQSINIQKPEKIIYVASRDSRKIIKNEIETHLQWRGVVDSETITLSDHQNLLACVQDIREGVNKAFVSLQLAKDTRLVADITGGTKVMSSALTLVMMEYPSRFTYVGGDQRSKEGLGIVEDGHEIFMTLDNPWEVMAFRGIQKVCDSFNTWDFGSALALAKEISQNMGEKEKFYQCLEDVIEGYAAWDTFQHKNAQNILKQALGKLKLFTMHCPDLGKFYRELDANKKILDAVQEEASILLSPKNKPHKTDGRAYLFDLLANAKRRYEKARYDDAVARLYSAIEKIAKITLKAEFGINNSEIDLSLIPDTLHEGLKSYGDADGSIKIGLQASFELLNDLGHDLGKTHHEHALELKNCLQARNSSLLAHGYTPVRKQACENLFKIALKFLNIQEDELPGFITLDWNTFILKEDFSSRE